MLKGNRFTRYRLIVSMESEDCFFVRMRTYDPVGPAEAQCRIQAAAGRLLQTCGGRGDRAHPGGRSHERYLLQTVVVFSQ